MCSAHKGFSLAPVRLLLVDDDESIRSGLQFVLEAHEFEVVTAPNVNEALKYIATQSFDVLLSDLHMPGAGDGLIVVGAMRQANPRAVTILLSANPDMAKATAAILQQVDDIMRKPVKVGPVVEMIRQRLAQDTSKQPTPTPSPTPPPAPPPHPADPNPTAVAVATIIERDTPAITQAWLAQLDRAASHATLPSPLNLTLGERCEHLPEALRDIVFRLRYSQPIGAPSLFSMTALQHGARRRRQGIGAATLGEEARALQVALFQTIQNNLDRIDPAQLPAALMAIADEVNAQLLQALAGYENEQPVEAPWGFR